jgi:hypothetical protein
LIRSNWLLDIVINTLEEWSTKNGGYSSNRRLRSSFLRSSSWEYRHSHKDMHPADGLTDLLASVEHAFKLHARADDAWWRRREPQLRSAQEEMLLCFLAQAYKENPEANVDGMASIMFH